MPTDRLPIVRVGIAVALASSFGLALAAEPDAKNPPARHVDLYGDPLPSQAALRLGTLRFHDEYVQAAAFSPDGHILATAALNFGTRNALWEVSSGRMLRRLNVQGNNPPSAHALAFSPDGKKLLTGDVGGALHMRDVGSPNRTQRTSVRSPIRWMATPS